MLDAVPGESVVIVCDDEKKEIGKAFADGALALGFWTRLMILKTSDKTRTEVPPQLLEVLTQQNPDIYINLMRGGRRPLQNLISHPYSHNSTVMKELKSRIFSTSEKETRR